MEREEQVMQASKKKEGKARVREERRRVSKRLPAVCEKRLHAAE